MKKIIFLFPMLMLFALLGCDSTQEDGLLNETSPNTCGHISLERAVKAAIDFRKNQTRDCEDYRVEFLLSDKITRSDVAKGDTLAYVINFGDDQGYVIEPYLANIEGPLAFSEVGHYEVRDADSNVVLKEAISNFNTASTLGLPDPITPTNPKPQKVGPYVSVNLHGYAPYSYYVELNGDVGQGLGCGAVADAMIISNCENIFTYNGGAYKFEKINEALNEGSSRIEPTENNEYTYSTAVRAMAKFMYDLRVDMGTFLKNNLPVAYNSRIVKSLVDAGCVTPFTTDQTFNQSAIVDYLIDKHIILMFGKYANGVIIDGSDGGHAWVCDGYKIIATSPSIGNSTAASYYLHYNWGAGGANDGYYNSKIFTPGENNTEYDSFYYFPVKINK